MTNWKKAAKHYRDLARRNQKVAMFAMQQLVERDRVELASIEAAWAVMPKTRGLFGGSRGGDA